MQLQNWPSYGHFEFSSSSRNYHFSLIIWKIQKVLLQNWPSYGHFGLSLCSSSSLQALRETVPVGVPTITKPLYFTPIWNNRRRRRRRSSSRQLALCETGPVGVPTITKPLLFGIIGGVVVVVGNTITEAVVLRTDRPIR